MRFTTVFIVIATVIIIIIIMKTILMQCLGLLRETEKI